MVSKTVFVLLSILLMNGIGFSQNKIGLFDTTTAIGDPLLEGNAIYTTENQTYTLSGAGSNMWFNSDEFQYLWTTIQGDFILRTTVKFVGAGTDPHRKVGWMVKNNLDANSKHINATTHGDGLTSLQYRKTVNGITEEIKSKSNAPTILQLERRGTTYIMSTAKFGEPFTSIELTNMEMDEEVYVGIYICSHNPKVMESATFSNVRVIKPVAPDFKPYEDYLGSNLELMDIDTGERKILYQSAHSIQAPNWTVDGEKLIYNSKGRLFNFQLNSAKISPLNTGFATKNNNDHVLTFDGSLMGISHHNPEDNGTSALYYLPTSGDSIPVMVTTPGVGASYLHGWSPDNKKMIFTGNRNGKYDIYSISLKNGKERQLTNTPTLDDGSEYSPDGKYIYFNSSRTGTMQLWRMKPNGKEQTQLTFDTYNDWFPHVSPDKKWVVFISFPPSVAADDHPFYEHCVLRIMPYEGGTPKILAHVYGGQGTINVPSWSPDSKKIAFVSNTGSY